MIYSVWNDAARAYDYYEGAGGVPDGTVKPSHLRPRDLGVTPEMAAWPLPTNVVHVGRGIMPKGQIASTSSRALPLAALGLAAVAAYFLWRKKR